MWFRIRMLWLANTSNLILNFTYLKAALLALWRAILCKNLEFKATGEVATPGKQSRTCHFCSFQWWSIRSVALNCTQTQGSQIFPTRPVFRQGSDTLT